MPTTASITEYARLCAQYNLPLDKNDIGESGEKLVAYILCYFPFFRVYFLDGKAPIEDFLGEINNEKTPYPFFVQVKSTTEGTNGAGNLKAQLEESKRLALINRPIPTYLAGVDLNKMEVYFCPVFDVSVKYGVIPAKHVVKVTDLTNWAKEMEALKQDVIDYWTQSRVVTYKPTYKSKL